MPRHPLSPIPSPVPAPSSGADTPCSHGTEEVPDAPLSSPDSAVGVSGHLSFCPYIFSDDPRYVAPPPVDAPVCPSCCHVDGYFCTLALNHDGPHVSHGGERGKIAMYCQWTDAEA